MIQHLDGNGWKAQYFRAKRPLVERETELNNLLMADGLDAGCVSNDYDDESWFKASVPSDVRDILFRNKVIPDPYFGRNSDATAWVVDYEWWYRTRFKIPAKQKGKRIRLVFQGVDLFADYYLNGKPIGSSNDMFVKNVFEVTDRVAFGKENILAVCLHPQPKSSANHFWKGEIPQRAYYHKAQVSWGWDWSREMISMGIWDGVHLEFADTVFIKDMFVEGKPKGENEADVRVELKFNSTADFNGEVHVVFFDEHTGRKIGSKIKTAPFKRGDQQQVLTTSLKDIRLWHPNGYGDQSLYRCSVTVLRNGQMLVSKKTKFGVRKIKMLPNTEKPAGAYNLVFSINGARIFAMGANWVPTDLLFARANAGRYECLVKKAADLGFNMFRVWGGGLIEKEAFYDYCDRYGILVWQEFPLACANYPKNRQYVVEKETEADAIIKKLRNHPCIALYCGGNELFYYGETSRSPVLHAFKKKVSQLHPAIDYHFSSPDKEREGERDHGPWTYQEKHHSFWNKHFRNFASELGCNACLGLESIKKIMPYEDIKKRSPSLKHHFVNLEDFERTHAYAGVKLFNCRTDEDIIFASQFVQADTLAYIMGKYRACVWKSSGVLFWQYNSAWPEGAWSIIDYYGAPKLAYHFLKETCARDALHIEDQDWELRRTDCLNLKVHFLDDHFRKDKKYEVVFSMINKTGKVCHQESRFLESGTEVMISLGRKTLDLKERFFRLNASVVLDSSKVVERNQFYALATWKEVAIQEIRESVFQFVKRRI